MIVHILLTLFILVHRFTWFTCFGKSLPKAQNWGLYAR